MGKLNQFGVPRHPVSNREPEQPFRGAWRDFDRLAALTVSLTWWETRGAMPARFAALRRAEEPVRFLFPLKNF
jgi:hypothetical protein